MAFHKIQPTSNFHPRYKPYNVKLNQFVINFGGMNGE